jgi:hypothetical protein
MGDVVPFISRAGKRVAAAYVVAAEVDGAEQAVRAAAPSQDQYAVLTAAGPLLERVRDRYGFAVMRDGLPADPDALATALVTLLRGLSLLDGELGPGRCLSTFGVYFGGERLAWFDDGFGDATGLTVPEGVDPAELARFVRPRIREARA